MTKLSDLKGFSKKLNTESVNQRLVEALEDIARGKLQCPDFEQYAVAKAKQALESSKTFESKESKLREALDIMEKCGQPEKVSLYDEEGVEGWKWTHPDGREWMETRCWEDVPLFHPLVCEALKDAKGELWLNQN